MPRTETDSSEHSPGPDAPSADVTSGPSQVMPGVHVLVKPIGPVCNLACEYCYYLHKDQLYPDERSWRMSDDTLRLFIKQYIDCQPPAVPEIEFAWQGGEPTLLGIDFFQRVVDLQKQLAPPDRRCRNAIQTNGVLLDDAWCEFLRDHGFLVGLSIDGPADLHDRYRHDKEGRPTFDRVLAGLRCLQKHGVPCNALTVVNRHNGSHPRRVYRLLKEVGFEFIQFIPIVEPAAQPASGQNDPDTLVSDRSVRPRQFGMFLIEVFEEWLRNDVGRIFVQTFDQALSGWVGVGPTLCEFTPRCGRALLLEHNGDLYSCDHFASPDYRLGNIHETPLSALASCPQQIQFGRDKEDKLPAACRKCCVRFVCNGGCPKNRIAVTANGEAGLNYLCEGYRLFFEHIDPVMRAMAQEVRNGRPASNVTQRLHAPRGQAAPHGGHVGRNDPCPCGSGKKYKHCCGRAQ